MSGHGTDIFQSEPWSLLRVEDLGEAVFVPTMLSYDEQRYYVWLTREWSRGDGVIVDLGAFAGGSTACLAEGQRQAGRNAPVHGYDKFLVNDFSVFRKRCDAYMARPPASDSTLTPPELPESHGDDLRPVVQKFLSPWAKDLHLHKGQIEEETWDRGAIEVLVLDASKAADTTDRMSEVFFPHLIPGRSIIVQQDFLLWQQPWIAAQMALLTDFFEPVAYVPNYSVSFLCKKGLDAETVRRANTADLSDKEMQDRIRQMMPELEKFDLQPRLRKLIRAIRENPGRRKAYQFKTAPK